MKSPLVHLLDAFYNFMTVDKRFLSDVITNETLILLSEPLLEEEVVGGGEVVVFVIGYL